MASSAVLAGDVAVGVASPAIAAVASLADFAGDVAIGVISPAVAGAASLADLAGDVAASPAIAGAVSLANFSVVVTTGVTPLAVAGVASPAVVGVASPACSWRGVPDRPCWGVTVGVASLADAGVVSLFDAGVASLADAGVASLADLAGSVAGGVTDLAVPVRVETNEMTLLQCVVRHCSVFVYRDSEVDCCGCVSPNAWCQGMCDVRDDSVCEYVDYVGCDPDCVDRTGDDYPKVVTIIRSGRCPLSRFA